MGGAAVLGPVADLLCSSIFLLEIVCKIINLWQDESIKCYVWVWIGTFRSPRRRITG
jgi:hypothetical protein